MVSKDQKEDKNRDFQQALLTWAKSNLRTYPWRKTGTSAYEILIAELLLKRTTATAAARLYDTFIEKYPAIYQLANTSIGELASDLETIGLSRQRSRAIKELAQALVENHKGKVPTTFEQLRSLPGIGDYAARAIMSFGHDIPSAVVDGNVERVLYRVSQNKLAERSSKASIQNMADNLLPKDRHRNFNFALLDLGSVICRPTMPSCHKCPLQKICDYARSSNIRHIGWLQALRKARKMSQLALARKANTTKLTIINIEAGRTLPREETLRRIALALDVSLEEIEEGVLNKSL